MAIVVGEGAETADGAIVASVLWTLDGYGIDGSVSTCDVE